MTKFFLSTLLTIIASVLSAQCVSIVHCNPSDTLLVCAEPGNNPELWNHTSFNAHFNGSDDLFEGAAKITLTAAKTPNCIGTTQLRFVLQLDLNADGAPETFIDSDQLPAPGTLYFDNGSSPGTLTAWDTRNVPEADKYQFAINWHETTDSIFAELALHTLNQPGTYLMPLLPQGAQSILWEVSNNGSVATCLQHFFVADCTAPAVTCINGMTISLQQTAIGPFVTLLSTDFIQSSDDNTTAPSALQNGVILSGTGGFPTPSIGFDCSMLGTQSVVLYVTDEWGNQGFCSTQIEIEDPSGWCVSNPNHYIRPCVKMWCNNEEISGIDEFTATVHFAQGFPDATYEITDNCGLVQVDLLPESVEFEIVKNDDMLNGVSVLDLWRTARHILGIEPFTHAAQLVAADANQSGSVTTYDIVLFSMLMLDMPVDPLAIRPSWTFIDSTLLAEFSLNEITNLPPITSTPVLNNPNFPISAIKTGDVTCDALPAAAPGNDDRTVEYISLPNWTLAAGDEIEVPLTFMQAAYRTAFQLGLSFDPALLTITDYATTIYNGNPEFVNNDIAGQFSLLWFDAQNTPFYPSGSEIVRLKVRALAPLALHDVLFLQSGTPSLSYQMASETELRLDYTTAASEPGTSQELSLSVTPNPVSYTGATLTIQSKQIQSAIISIFDVTGRRCASWAQELPQGQSNINLPISLFDSGLGVYTCTVTTANSGTLSRKMVRL